jgi:hypothetical protein
MLGNLAIFSEKWGYCDKVFPYYYYLIIIISIYC